MKVTYEDWQKRRRALLPLQVAALERYEATAVPPGQQPPPRCGAKPLGGVVDTRPRDPEHWEAMLQICRALAAARSKRWRWIGPRHLVILSPADERAASANGR